MVKWSKQQRPQNGSKQVPSLSVRVEEKIFSSVRSELYVTKLVRGFAAAIGGGDSPRADPRAYLQRPAPTVPLLGGAALVNGEYSSATTVLLFGSCGLVRHRLVYRLTFERGPRPRLSAKGVCMNGNAIIAVLGRAKGLAGGLHGNTTPAGLRRARDRGVAGGFDATEGLRGRSNLGVHICSRSNVHVESKYLVWLEERPSSRTLSVRRGLQARR